jgi:Ca2+-binding RTX toxin-like protein
MKKTLLFTTIAFILTLGLANIYFFEQVDAQSSSNSTGSKVISTPSTSHSNTESKVTSSLSNFPANNGHVNLAQIKSTIFNVLAKCIQARTCSPLMGSEGDDRIQAGNGSYVIIGLGGNDIIHGGTGDNVIIGGAGDDVMYGGGGNNIIVASGTGNDQIYGGNQSNILIAGGGSNLLVAGKGNDKLYGGGGNDVFIGGPGADYFSCGTAGSKSVVMNFNAAKGDDTDGNCGTVLGQ